MIEKTENQERERLSGLIPIVLMCAVSWGCNYAVHPLKMSSRESVQNYLGPVLEPIDVDRLKVTEIKTIASISRTELKGLVPTAVCWSPDSSGLLIHCCKAVGGGVYNPTNYVGDDYSLALTGGGLTNLDVQPPWARETWARKSSVVSPCGTPIRVGDRSQRVVYLLSGTIIGRATAHWSDFPALGCGTNVRAVVESEEFDYLYPGSTYSWAPPGGRAIVYTDEYKMFILSEDGRRKKKVASGNYSLPAWSDDGGKIAVVSYAFPGMVWKIDLVSLDGIRLRQGESEPCSD
jgi:hypothetical protein